MSRARLAAFFPPPHCLFPIPLLLGITPPNAFLHFWAPEVHAAEPTSADALQATMLPKTCSAGRLRIMFLIKMC